MIEGHWGEYNRMEGVQSSLDNERIWMLPEVRRTVYANRVVSPGAVHILGVAAHNSGGGEGLGG